MGRLDLMLAVTVFATAAAIFADELAAHSADHSPLRHQFVMPEGIPAEYRDAVNPLATTSEALSLGAELYEGHCASCHGARGEGDGPMAEGLDPAPPELISMMGMPMVTDGYLLWCVSDGGGEIGTAMPAFIDVLTIEERWQVILFMKNGFAR